MATLNRVLDVAAPVTVAFTAWADLKHYPRFMEGVTRVEAMGPSRWRFRGDIGFGEETWEVGLLDAVPDLMLSWESTSVRHTAMSIQFSALGLGRTRLSVSFSFDPHAVMQSDPEAFMTARLDRILERYRKVVEGDVAGAAERSPAPP